MSKPSYAPGFLNLVGDPYVKAEFEKLIAYVNGVALQSDKEAEKGLDDHTSNPPDPPDDPDEPSQEDGVRWLRGPWLLNPDGDVRGFAAIRPPQLTGDVNDYSPTDMDSAIILELSSTQEVNITGIRIKARQRRILGILNMGGFTIRIVNQSTSSQAVHRFSWGDTGDAGETIGIPTGQMAWMYYNVVVRQWKLFSVPAVGSDNLPPSIVPEPATFPPAYSWFASHFSRITTSAIGIGEDNPQIVGDTFNFIQDSEGNATRSNTIATTGGSAGIGGNTVAPSTLQPNMDPDWTVIMRAPTSLANLRIWIIFASVAPTNNDDLGGGSNYFGWRYSTVAGDGGWVGVSRDGTTQSVTATVASISANVLYKLRVRKTGASLFFSVNDGTEVEKTNNLPTSNVSIQWYHLVFTTENVSKNLTWYRHNVALRASAFA